MNRGRVTRPRIEKIDGTGEIEVGVVRAQKRERRQAGLAFDGHIRADEHGGSARRPGGLSVARIGDKRQFAGFGRFDSRNAVNFGEQRMG